MAISGQRTNFRSRIRRFAPVKYFNNKIAKKLANNKINRLLNDPEMGEQNKFDNIVLELELLKAQEDKGISVESFINNLAVNAK
ncbi:MAG: hypothetical protein HRT90_04695 [Candidatus Margulisbacteria bacterium]|nr:hypothetical protein [Candidatus Margulisiibacteriota bacterium]